MQAIEGIDNELARTCAHELGHAIVMRALGFSIDIIRVRPFFGGGFCTGEKDYDTWAQVMETGAVDLAGYQAEDRWNRENDLGRASSWGSGPDFASFRARVRWVRENTQGTDEPIEMREQKIRAHADEILAAHWNELNERLPDLAKKSTMNGLGVA
jgi:hypothetical protein